MADRSILQTVSGDTHRDDSNARASVRGIVRDGSAIIEVEGFDGGARDEAVRTFLSLLRPELFGSQDVPIGSNVITVSCRMTADGPGQLDLSIEMPPDPPQLEIATVRRLYGVAMRRLIEQGDSGLVAKGGLEGSV